VAFLLIPVLMVLIDLVKKHEKRKHLRSLHQVPELKLSRPSIRTDSRNQEGIGPDLRLHIIVCKRAVQNETESLHHFFGSRFGREIGESNNEISRLPRRCCVGNLIVAQSSF
jgi:hypothetical protein